MDMIHFFLYWLKFFDFCNGDIKLSIGCKVTARELHNPMNDKYC